MECRIIHPRVDKLFLTITIIQKKREEREDALIKRETYQILNYAFLVDIIK